MSLRTIKKIIQQSRQKPSVSKSRYVQLHHDIWKSLKFSGSLTSQHLLQVGLFLEVFGDRRLACFSVVAAQTKVFDELKEKYKLSSLSHCNQVICAISNRFGLNDRMSEQILCKMLAKSGSRFKEPLFHGQSLYIVNPDGRDLLEVPRQSGEIARKVVSLTYRKLPPPSAQQQYTHPWWDDSFDVTVYSNDTFKLKPLHLFSKNEHQTHFRSPPQRSHQAPGPDSLQHKGSQSSTRHGMYVILPSFSMVVANKPTNFLTLPDSLQRYPVFSSSRQQPIRRQPPRKCKRPVPWRLQPPRKCKRSPVDSYF